MAFTCQLVIILSKEVMIAVENYSLLIELTERKARQAHTLRLAMTHLRAH